MSGEIGENDLTLEYNQHDNGGSDPEDNDGSGPEDNDGSNTRPTRLPAMNNMDILLDDNREPGLLRQYRSILTDQNPMDQNKKPKRKLKRKLFPVEQEKRKERKGTGKKRNKTNKKKKKKKTNKKRKQTKTSKRKKKSKKVKK